MLFDFQSNISKLMAASNRSQFNLRRKSQDLDETLDLNQGFDSDIDEERSEEYDEPPIKFIAAANDEEFEVFLPVIDQNITENYTASSDDDDDTSGKRNDEPDGWNKSDWGEGDKKPTWMVISAGKKAS